MERSHSQSWLFSAAQDTWVFLGSTLASIALLILGAALGILDGESPPWVFLLCVVAVDVAHVWSTLFRVYLDREERSRRPWLYGAVPICCLGASFTLYTLDPLWFWRGLAYLAVYHFLRQQQGFLSLYHRRSHLPTWEKHLEQGTLLMAMLYPLLYWHSHLPQPFYWIIAGDFLSGLAPRWAALAAPVSYTLLLLHLLLQLRARRSPWNGRTLLIGTTALCWQLGILVYPSDYAFTVTNVLIHGIPYALLVYRYGSNRAHASDSLGLRPLRYGAYGVAYFLAVIWTLALLEEWLWHTLIFQDQGSLFGPAHNSPWTHPLWPAVLATPQLTHYMLDGFVWKRKHNPTVSSLLSNAQTSNDTPVTVP